MGSMGTYGKVELQDEFIDGLTLSIMEECSVLSHLEPYAGELGGAVFQHGVVGREFAWQVCLYSISLHIVLVYKVVLNACPPPSVKLENQLGIKTSLLLFELFCF